MTTIINGSSPSITFSDGSAQTSATRPFLNRLINGGMTIDQRNAGASVTPTGGSYTIDRWVSGASQASKYTVQQNAGSVTPPVGFTNYLGVTSSSAYSIASGDYFFQEQDIEGFNVADLGWGTANAKTVTLSFWVRSSLTGTFGGALSNNGQSRSYPFSYTISAANTFEYKTITVAGDTTGTWLTNNGVGMRVYFGLGVGSTYSGTAGSWSGNLYVSATGATSVVGTSGATFYITGVQLEVGSTATSFDYRPYGTELVLCQRYFYKMNGLVNQDMLVGAAADQTTWIRYSFALPVIMRTTPSLVSTAASTYTNLTGSGGQAGSAIALDNSSATNVTLNLNSGGITAGSAATFRIGSSPTGYVAFSSEL
jgi:hypothetical protein